MLVSACSRGGARPAVAPLPASPVLSPTAPRTLGGRPTYQGSRDSAWTDEDLEALWQRQLMVPVDGIDRRVLRNDFEAKRGGERLHGALDIAAPRLTAVLAADDCVIGRLFTGPVGGIVIYASDPDARFVYYYAHLQRYRSGLAVGDRVAKGTVLGYVGTTGNAPPDLPHLHFQVMKRGLGRAWWDGPPINPFFFFAFDGYRL